MMICRADFEELFPETFRPTPKSGSGQSPLKNAWRAGKTTAGRHR